MLYPTQHHTFSYRFHHPYAAAAAAVFRPLTPSSAVSFQGMECVLKSSVKPEPPCFDGDVGGSSDDFFVDDLLDLSNGFAEDVEEKEKVKTEQSEKKELSEKEKSNVVVSVKPEKETVTEDALAVTFSVKEEEFSCLAGDELKAPADDLDSLEWLSNFVEDSFSGHSLTVPVGKLPPENKKRPASEFPVGENRKFTTPVQTKSRTKRLKTGAPVWLTGSPSSSTTSSSSSTTTLSSSPPYPFTFCPNPVQNPVQTAESLKRKKPKKKSVAAVAGGACGGAQPQPRRCGHCGVQKTPQWRAGPLGAKTLCNACGVRFKSGRLLPEYRPACSPTFSSQLHSNNHRKVLEMRRKKETESNQSGLAQPVQSF